MKMFRLFILLSSVLSFTACTSTTVIRTSDPMAKIFVDGELRGTGTTVHTDQKIVGSTTNIRIEKDGCIPQNFVISKNEEFNVGACIGGVLILVPFLWIMSYKPERVYEYKCVPMK